MNALGFIFTFSLLCETISGLNILAVFPHEGKSHQMVSKPIVQHLAIRGHTVTVIIHSSSDIKIEGYEEIVLGDVKKTGEHFFDMNMFKDVSVKVCQAVHPFVLTDLGLDSCAAMFSNSEVQNLLRSQKTFDVILAEFFNSECYLAFVDYFKSPLIGISSGTLMPWHNDRIGNPSDPSYIPNNHLWHGMRMNFMERVESLLGTFWYNTVYWFRIRESQEVSEKYLKKELSPFHDLMMNTSLVLTNSHFSWTFPRPLVPGIVEIGGVHIQKANKLPKNIEKFINESTHGVIYFSLGSMIKGYTFPEEKRKEFLNAFARLPQRVLWKWENDTMPEKPDKVMTQKWMPQFDILSHPNVKAFISHGGLLGSTEAIHCGVPMIVMPQYGDQHANAKAIEANDGGVILYLKEANEEKVFQSLKTILDPKFKAKTQALSERFRDRPMSPMDTAIYWVEYVARHKGAPHLRTAAVNMPLYQYLLLDVLAFLALILFLFVYITYKILRFLFIILRSKSKLKQN